MAITAALIIWNVLAVQLLSTPVQGRFVGALEKFSGQNTAGCAAIVDRCIKRCVQRAADGEDGIEYVQWKITYYPESTFCMVRTTSGSEIVSANPPNDDKMAAVFNVPCCQQKPIFGDPGIAINQTVATPATPAATIPPVLGRTAFIPQWTFSVAPPLTVLARQASKETTPVKATTPEKPNTKEDLNLVFNILALILILLLVLLVTKKLIKKKFRKRAFNKSTNQTSPEMSNLSNGGIQITMASDLTEVQQTERSAQEVLSEAMKNIQPPATNEYSNEGPITATKFQPRDDDNNLDYIVLDPVTSTPPKSARSGSRGQSGKSEEVLIIGGGRGNVYRADPTSSAIVPNGAVVNFDHGEVKIPTKYDEACSPMFSLENTPTNTIQPQLPGRNSDKANTRIDFMKRRSDSLPETRAAPREVEYDKLETGRSEDAEMSSMESVSRASAANRSFGTSSLDSAPLQTSRNIYNVLDNGDKTDKRTEYYQRLKRSQRTRNKDVEVENVDNTTDATTQPTTDNPYEDDYVKDFEILKMRHATNGMEETTLPGISENTNGSGYVFAKEIQRNGSIPNGSAKLMGQNEKNKHINEIESLKQHTAETKLLETDEL